MRFFMSRKYFLFSALAIMLLVGIFDFVYAVYYLSRLSSFTNTEIIVTFVLAAVNIGLCVPSLVFTIKAFRRKENNLVASVLLIIASTMYFGYRMFSVAKTLKSAIYPDEDIEMVMYWMTYAFSQALIGLLPVALAILSLVTFKKSEQDYVPSRKINKIFYYIVLAFAFQAFLSLSTTGIRGTLILRYSSSESISNIVQALIYLIGSLGIIGCAIPSFVFSFFERKKDLSRNLLLVAAFIIIGIYIWSTIVSIQQSKAYSISGVTELIIVESVGIFLEIGVIIAGSILMFVKFKTKQPEQTKPELE